MKMMKDEEGDVFRSTTKLENTCFKIVLFRSSKPFYPSSTTTTIMEQQQQQQQTTSSSYSSNEVVLLAVYDLSRGMARGLSAQFLGPDHAIDVIPHTGLVVYGMY